MSKKLLLPSLTEWLITYGTNPVDTSKRTVIPITMIVKALRLGYLEQVSSGQSMMKLTKEGIRYLQENQQ
jgi:hypothetical protein